ncbi:MAG: YoaK family protein [Gemmatirosa sp.]
MSPVRAAVAQRLFYRHRYRVTAAAAVLAVVAGFVNAAAIALTSHPVSHHTGTIARLSQDAAFGRLLDLELMLALIGAFFVGAMASGAIVGTRRLLPGRRYGVVLVVEGAVLVGSAAALTRVPVAGLLLAATASGLQNGMANSFYGVVVRTTHVSGILTDLAVQTGHWLRRRPVQGWRAAFQAGIVAGFVLGSVGGAWAARHGGAVVLLAPAALCLVGGMTYVVLTTRHARHRRSRVRRASRATVPQEP